VAAAIVLVVVGVLISLIGLLLMVVGAGGASLIEYIDPSMGAEAGAIAAVILVFALVFLALGIAGVASAIGVFVHKSWGRWLGVVVGTIGLVLGFLLLIGSFAGGTPDTGDLVIGIVWLGANAFAVAALAAAGEHFQPSYPGR
jgi:hypothetical protein